MSTGNAQVATGGVPPGWETHIYPGVQVADVSLAARAALASALGEAGVEAEYFLLLLTVISWRRSTSAGDRRTALQRAGGVGGAHDYRRFVARGGDAGISGRAGYALPRVAERFRWRW